ncbi:MAG: transporter [Chitinophagaceae bacterium]|nr:transporter [Chitinophagaceae bacterium]
MKKYLVSLMVILILPFFSMACDICGCGVGNSYIGILPDFNKRIIGLRYRYNSIFTHVGIGGATTYLTTNELYRTVEIWGGWNITKNFRLMTSVPYSFNEKLNQGTRQTKNGISDINLSGLYQLVNTQKTMMNNKMLVQTLWVGGGIKLPTGKYNPKDKSSTSDNANLFQLGTGSLDFSVNAMYDIRLQDAGFNVSGSYKINTSNRYAYSYGNKVNANAQAYYKIRIKKAVTVAPNAGVQFENSKHDVDNHLPVDISGGQLLLGTLGIEAAFRKTSVGANWQTPLSQSLADGIVKANNRMMVHVSFLL